jgi:hypothetical protein
MKKIAGKILKIVTGFILAILILLFTVPLIFKDKIKTKVQSVINESVNARVTFGDYRLTFFRNFPNLSFSLKDLNVVGVDKFEGDTLAGFKSFDLVFNLGSLLGKSGYEVKSIIIDMAAVNAIVLKDGSANWDIAKPSETSVTTDTITQSESAPTESTMKVLLRKFEIKNSAVSYSDESMNLQAFLKDLNYTLSGDMTLSQTDLEMNLKAGETTVSMDGIKYLNKAAVDSKVSLQADLDSMKFTFGENYLTINDLILNFSGVVSMPGDDIATDVSFGTKQTSFKTLLSMVPAVYMTGYEDLKASGEFKLSGSARGIYSDADSTLPDIKMNLAVANGLISYPDLPEKISNININSDLFIDGRDLDRTTVDVGKFHFELAGSPFDMTMFLRTPISDPDIKASMNGRIDLSALSKAVPIDSISISGVIEMAIAMSGKMSMIEKEQYESFSAKGTLGIKGMSVEMKGYPGVEVKEASFLFTPAFTQMQKAEIIIEGKSDYLLSGNIENYIPYIFRNETIRGKLTLHSNLTDASSIMKSMETSDSAAIEVQATAQTTVDSISSSNTVIAVPKNIDFDFNAVIDRFSYDNINAENLKGHIIVRDGIVSFRETGMNILGGSVLMNADYDTRDTLKPVMKADMDIKNIEIRDAYKTFVTVRKFAPTAKGIKGKINMQLAYESQLGRDMMPVLETIDGTGRLQSEEVQLLESATFDKFKEVLKLGDKYSNTFRDIDVNFTISDGRVYVKPFNVKLGNIKMNIGGDQGLDQTINYLVRTEIPRSELGSSVNSMIDNLSATAATFGIVYKPADIIKVNVRVRGTFTRPEVSPDFGDGSTQGTGGGATQAIKETVKQTVDQTVDKTKEQLREEAAIQGDRLIQEAEVQGQKLRDEAANSAFRLKQEADSSAARLIKSAETKNVLAKAAAQKGADALKKEADRRGAQLIREADVQANKLVEEAKAKKEELIKKI